MRGATVIIGTLVLVVLALGTCAVRHGRAATGWTLLCGEAWRAARLSRPHSPSDTKTPHPTAACSAPNHPQAPSPSPTPVAVTACAVPLVFKQTTAECLACSDASEYIYTDAKCCKCVGSAPLPEVGAASASAAVASASGRLGLPAAALAAVAALTSLLT
jgi:hypothetical protein